MAEATKDADPRLQAAEMMWQRLSCHPGATPATRRLAEDLVAALRRVIQDAARITELIASGTNPESAPPENSLSDSLDDLDARAGDLLGALAALHGVIVRRDLTGPARALVDAERMLSELHALKDSARSAEGDGEG